MDYDRSEAFKQEIVVPREAHEALKLKVGDKLLVVVRGDVLLMTRKPRSFAKRIEGWRGTCTHSIIWIRKEKSWE